MALMALTGSAASLHATNTLTATPASVSVTCNTATGPGSAASVVIKPVTALTGSATITVAFNAPGNGLVVTAPQSPVLTLANQAAGLTYTVNTIAGCAAATTGATQIQFKNGATNDVTVTANDTVTATSTPLVASPITVTCIKSGSSYTPGSAQTVSVTSGAPGGTAFTVDTLTVAPPAWLTLSSTAGGTATSTPVTFTVAATAGCGGFSSGTSNVATLHLLNAPAPDKTVTVTLQVVPPGASALVASPVTVTCAKSGSVYTPGSPQTVSVTSTDVNGTTFTVDTVTSAPPAWLVVTPTTGGTASSTPVTFTVAAASGCGAFSSGTSNVATLHLLNAPALDKLVTVTLQIVPPTPLVANPAAPSLTYVKGSGTAGHVDVALSSVSSPAPFFALNTATLPIWLTVDSTTGTVPKSLRFTSTSVCDTLAPGTYTASIGVRVSGYADLTIPVTLQLNNKAPRLSVAEGTTRTIQWTLGTPLPTPIITAVSSDSPIAYTTSSGGTLAPAISPAQQSGLAYGFGTPINVSFNPLIFAAAQPGSVLTGTVTLTWGSPASTIVVTFNISILSPGATLTGLTPASLPTANAGQTFTLVLTGTGFVTSTDPSQKTKVGVVVNGAIIADTNFAANVINPSNIILTITVPAVADANLPFAVAGAGGPINIGICNPAGATCSIPSGTATLTIGTGPIIQAVTSASAFTQVTPPALPSMAPYDMVSVFGANFCSSGGTGCGSSQILYGSADASLRYPTSLSPDSAGATQRLLSVIFQTHGSSPALIATAPLLFSTNGQINLLVPSALSTYIGGQVDMVVNFGYGSGNTLKSSAPFTVNVIATNPGLFTVGANGAGDGAILNSNYAQVTATAPAGMRSTAADSDTVQFYLTGLGTPDSTADNASAGSSYAWHADCISVSSYLTSLNTAAGTSLTNVDGTVLQSSLFNSLRLPPCVRSNSANVPTVTVGGQAGTVVYAGFVPDSIAGLYQINVLLPGTTPGSGAYTTASGASLSSITAPVQLPVVVTSNGVSSQAGVTMWVIPSLKVTPPSGGGLTGTVGIPWSSSSNVVIATEGTSPYSYKLTSGLLPAGLSMNAATGVISGTPSANSAGTYMVTVTATDSANVPVKGSVSFALTVAGGLFVTSSGSAPYSGTFGTANANVTRVTAAGGVFPYAYSITSPGTLPAGMTINAATGVIGITALTPAGTYHVTVLSVDSTAGTPLSGTITFDITVALHLAKTSTVNGANGVASNITTVSATGNTGSITYTLDAATLALPNGWVTIDSTTGVVSITTDAPVAASTTVTVTATDGAMAPGATSAATGTITFTFAVI